MVIIDLRNPLDIALTYDQMDVERSSDGVSGWTALSGSPVTIDTKNEYTSVTDMAGTATSYYRHRFRHSSGTPAASAYSTAMQVGDSIPEQWVKKDITDTAVTTLWDTWLDQTMIDLYALGIWKRSTQDITITTATTGGVTYTVESYGINAALRDVFRAEWIDKTVGTHVEFLNAEEWDVEDRNVRLYEPDTTYKLRLHGKAQYKRLGELTDDYYMLVCWMLREKYCQHQIDIRRDWRRFIMSDPNKDTTPEQLVEFLRVAQAEIAWRRRALEEPEPARGAEM